MFLIQKQPIFYYQHLLSRLSSITHIRSRYSVIFYLETICRLRITRTSLWIRSKFATSRSVILKIDGYHVPPSFVFTMCVEIVFEYRRIDNGERHTKCDKCAPDKKHLILRVRSHHHLCIPAGNRLRAVYSGEPLPHGIAPIFLESRFHCKPKTAESTEEAGWITQERAYIRCIHGDQPKTQRVLAASRI
jgi:hypothetical protein